MAPVGATAELRGTASTDTKQTSSSSECRGQFPKVNSLGTLRGILASNKGALSRQGRTAEPPATKTQVTRQSNGLNQTSNEQQKQGSRKQDGTGTASKRKKQWHKLPNRRLRWDLQRRRETKAGCRSKERDADEAAIEEMERDIYTAASRRSASARLTWWRVRAETRGTLPYPLTRSKLTLMAALLKKGKYLFQRNSTCTQRRGSMSAWGTCGTMSWT